MLKALQQFRANLSRAREHGELATIIAQITKDAIDVSDIWRSQIVLAVSALDHLIHEMTRIGMLECAKGVRAKSSAFSRFAVPLSSVELALNGQDHELWLGEAVREKHSWLSFQHPDKIADAIRLFSSISLWDEVSKEMGLTSKDIKIRLQLIVERRNKIAHEADMDPTFPGTRWPISGTMAVHSLDFVETVAEGIFKVAC